MSLYKKIINSLPEVGRLTSWPAAMMDRVYLEEPRSWLAKTRNFIKLRAIYAFLFTPLSIVDLVTSGLLARHFAFRSLFVADSLQEKRLKQQGKYATIFSKNLYAILAFPIGLIYPKLIAFYFTPEKHHVKGIKSGGSYYHAKTTIVKHPEDVSELRAIVRKAASKGYKIMPVGAGLSQGKQFFPEGGKSNIVVDLDHFKDIVIDPVTKTATVGAGVRWCELQQDANKHKLAIKVMQASNVFSVGGSIGTNIHGWDHQTGTVSNTIISINIVNAKGEEQTLTPNDKLFHQVTGGMGLFGIVTSVKLQLTDNIKLQEKGKVVHLSEYVNHFYNNVQTNKNTCMHLYRLSLDPNHLLESGISVNFDKLKETKPVVTPNFTPEDARGTRFNQVMINIARRIPLVRKWYWKSESERLVANQQPPLSINAIMQPPINAMFNPSVSEAEWLQEYFLPGDQLEAFTKQLGKMLMDNNVVLLNASIRFVKKNPNPLVSSYAAAGDRFAVVLCFNQSLQEAEVIKAKKWLREAQKLTVQHKGSYYLPYQHVSSPDDFQQSYPNAAKVRHEKSIADPKGVFTSGFYQKYIEKKSSKPNYFKIIMANEASKLKFVGFLDNVLQRVDTKKLYTLLEDVLKYNDSHDEIYQELCRRLPEIMPSTLGTVKRVLGSLKDIKHDLSAQAKQLLSGVSSIDGLVEIGYPGRFVGGFKKNFKVTGKITAVYEAPSITDYLQTGYPRPYDQFAKLDYSNPDLKTLADNSADVITCYVGLHHFPEDKLDAFLKDVRRVLRNGGHFILVDHDVKDDQSLAMAHMAHMIFNAVNGVSLQEEMSELRNFKPMTYWRDKLNQHGLGYAVEGPDVAMIREGDPSMNRMVSFVKRPLKPVLQPVVQPTIVSHTTIRTPKRSVSNANVSANAMTTFYRSANDKHTRRNVTPCIGAKRAHLR